MNRILQEGDATFELEELMDFIRNGERLGPVNIQMRNVLAEEFFA